MSNNRSLRGYRRVRQQNSTAHSVCGVVTSLNADDANTTNVQMGGAGTDRPNWRAVVSQRGDASNPFSADYYRVDDGGGYASALRTVPQTIGGCGSGKHVTLDSIAGFMAQTTTSIAVPTAMDSRALNSAISRFISNARSAQSPFQGGVFLGELRETIKMIRQPAKALFEELTVRYPRVVTKRLRGIKMRRGLASDKARAAERAVSGTWLEFSFGWQPLISDVKSGAEALARFLHYRPPLAHVSGTGSADVDEGTIGLTGGLFSFNNAQWRVRPVSKTVAYSYRLTGGLNLSSSGNTADAMRLASLEWRDTLPVVWELIPYSFLVDYFSNVGEVIEAATFCRSNLSYTSGFGRMTRTVDMGAPVNVPVADPAISNRAGGNSMKLHAIRVYRDVHPPLIPTLQFECPGVGSRKWLNIGALAAVRQKGGTLRNWF